MSELMYPVNKVPEQGQTIELTDGVKWLRMPLFLKLDHINLYLIKDGDGWFVVDTGLKSSKVQKLWESIFETELEGLPIKGIIVTHLHPDHVGQAGWLSRRWQVGIYMTQAEFMGTIIYMDTPSSRTDEYPVFFRNAGVPEDELSQMHVGGLDRLVEPMPRRYTRLSDNDCLAIGGREWRVIVGYGHSPEHACLYCEELNVLISGDQVLPKITPNISINSAEPDANLLESYLESLEKLKALPEATFVLPAHNEPFTGLHKRLTDIQLHHEKKLDMIIAECKEPRLAVDLLGLLFGRELKGTEKMLGLGECLAHLNCLIHRGRLVRTLEEEQHWYKTI
ncbi:MBL fold metallo-hydrolase [Endozoicomonas sp. OPT23]|uniref:MBL fold metallo-hydrolase n=1 Tax=Endozoicomonas sp. OPT23 TaxID=2072845 RepID=UPI00129B0B19|nr:MBL fold metallo-hydrolase [Endozoicomonas sp. OPT23]MRI34039.1 MBL fold metallo-hydrolase [Endozoicomonas sp. OPT23]